MEDEGAALRRNKVHAICIVLDPSVLNRYTLDRERNKKQRFINIYGDKAQPLGAVYADGFCD